MSDYFTVHKDAATGETTTIPWTPEEIAAREARMAALFPPVVPASVTPRQVRLLLLGQGLLSQVEELIAAQDEATKITWQYALEFKRNDPLLTSLAGSLGLTDQQVDEFFIAAAAL